MRLNLDLGTKTGYAIKTNPVTSGVWKLAGGRFEGGGMRFLRFKNCLADLHALTNFDEVAYEEVRRHRGTDAAHCYGALMGALTSWCEEQSPKIPYQGVPVGSIKKATAGKGNADKDQMIAAVQAKGFAPEDDNEADAIALMLMEKLS